MNKQRMNELADAFDQLVRYGGAPIEDVIDIVDVLVDINDDIQHLRAVDLVIENRKKVTQLTDKLLRSYEDTKRQRPVSS